MPTMINPAMPVSEIADRKPICVDRNTTILAVSQLMRLYRVAELVVTDEAAGNLVPVGVVSTRDIVTRVLAPELDATILTAGDLLWWPPPAAKASDSVFETLQLLQATKSDVVVLVDDDGTLAGIVSLDELLLATSTSARTD